MKASWQGYIALGRLGIPVRLYAATQSIQPKFVQLHREDHSPVQRILECKAEQRPISIDDVVRGVEYEPGRYITLSERELERTSPLPAKTIVITQFSNLDAVQPQYYEKPYYVVPGRGGERAYALMREVFVRTHMMAMAQVVLYGKEHIAALRVEGDLLLLLVLRFAGELVPRDHIRTPSLTKPSPAEVEALQAVVERFNGPFYMHDYHDERAEYIRDLVERKAKGLPMPRSERSKPQTTPEDDIVPILRDTLSERRLLPDDTA